MKYKNINKDEALIKTELNALNMLAKKHSKESDLASFVYGMTDKMIKDIKELKSAKHT